MMNLTGKEIAAVCGGVLKCEGEKALEQKISCAVIDSRQIQKDGLFFAVVGERVDGHKFISQVFDAGALLVITEKTPQKVQEETGIDCGGWKNYILVEDSLQALRELAEYYRKKTEIPVVGITGSVGKTSTKEFIASVLASRFNVLKTEGNFNNEIGVPLTLLRIRPETEVAVVEMGISDFGEMHRLSKMARPTVCVITNIGQCHLENLKTRDGILQAKSEIFDYMNPDGAICLNGEDDKLAAVKEMKEHIPHFFGLGGNTAEEVYAQDIVSHGLFGSDAVLSAHGEKIKVSVPLPGKHMVLNAAAAACVAQLFDLTGEEIAAGISRITPVSGRNNLIRGEKFTMIDDCYNANPGSMKAAIDLLSMADTEKVAILGDMFELGEHSDALHAEVGRYAAEQGINRIVCVGEQSVHMYEAACEYLQGSGMAVHFPNLEALMSALQEDREEYVPDSATVLIKASHGMHFTTVLEYLRTVKD